MRNEMSPDEAQLLREQAIRRRQRVIGSGMDRLKSVGVEDKDAERIVEGRHAHTHTSAHTSLDEAAVANEQKVLRKGRQAIVEMFALLGLELLAILQAFWDVNRQRMECSSATSAAPALFGSLIASFRISGLNLFLVWAQLSALAVRICAGSSKEDGQDNESLLAMISMFIALPRWLLAGVRSIRYLKTAIRLFKDFCLYYLTYQIAHVCFQLLIG